MSLSTLPDDIIMKILPSLLDPDVCLQKDYMNLAMNRKRFFQLAENKFNAIKHDNPETIEFAALHTFTVSHSPGVPTPESHNTSEICSQHSRQTSCSTRKARRRKATLCYKSKLSAALSNKHSTIRSILIVG